jgi:hypothetical protein
MKTKTFDCVEMKRRGAALVQEKVAGMTREQELQFWREQTELLRQQQKAVLVATDRSGDDQRR